MSYCTTLKRVCKVTSTFSQAFFGRSLSCTGYPDEPQNTIKATSTRAFPDIFESANFSLRFQKKSARIRIKIEICPSTRIRPVSDQYLACSRLRDGGGKSFSNKKCEKRAGAGESSLYSF